jgi:hypothetical protein
MTAGVRVEPRLRNDARGTTGMERARRGKGKRSDEKKASRGSREEVGALSYIRT